MDADAVTACLAALPLLLAHPAALRVLGETAAPRTRGGGAAHEEAEVPEELATALRDAAADADAARGRARLACV
jgi:hypothetical protein